MQILRRVQNFAKCIVTEAWNYLKSKDFKWVLNVVDEVHSLIYSGKEFQTSSAAQLNAQVILLMSVRGTTNWVVSLEDRSVRTAIWLTNSSDRYCGCCRLNAWNVRTAILNKMRSRTGSSAMSHVCQIRESDMGASLPPSPADSEDTATEQC